MPLCEWEKSSSSSPVHLFRCSPALCCLTLRIERQTELPTPDLLEDAEEVAAEDFQDHFVRVAAADHAFGDGGEGSFEVWAAAPRTIRLPCARRRPGRAASQLPGSCDYAMIVRDL